jgi:hypothetical protein
VVAFQRPAFICCWRIAIGAWRRTTSGKAMRPRPNGSMPKLDGITEPTLDRCYQVMETDNRALLDQWIANWKDLVDFEARPVITSAEARARVAPSL